MDFRRFHRIGLATGVVALVAGVVVLVTSKQAPPDTPARARGVVEPVFLTDPPADSGVAVAEVIQASRVVSENEEVDELLRTAIGAISEHPQLGAWLMNDDLARRFVSAVEAVADGYSPREELDFWRPRLPLFVRHDGGQPVITLASHRRYDVFAEALASVDPGGAAEAYRRLRPRFERIHDELPFARGDFHLRLLEAIDHLLEVAVPDGPYAVSRQVRTWAFADPDLERLSDAQRHLLRMGPDNARSVQRSLRQLRMAVADGTGGPGGNDVPTETAALGGDADRVAMAVDSAS